VYKHHVFKRKGMEYTTV